MTANVPERLEWSGTNGAEECFFCMTAEPGASFEEELRSLMARYRNLGDVVYLRDWADRETVRNRLMDSPLAAVPHVMLKAPVCRPGWLVEIDGIAVNGAGEPAFAPL